MTFQPAVREDVPLLVGLAGGTGAGKTVSALRLATGLAGKKRFALVDTENRRSRQYADAFKFDVLDLEAPFTPARYIDAIAQAETAGYPVVVIDSMSHEHAGDGGLLDMHDAELARMGGKDAAKMAAWIKPKAEHKRMVTRLLQVSAHVILCFRAEPKVEMVKDDRGKWQIVPKPTLTGLDGWVPVTEKNLPYELTVSALLTADAPGVPKPIKLPKPLRPMVPLNEPLTEQVGKQLGEWARGGKAKDPGPVVAEPQPPPKGSDVADPPAPDEPSGQFQIPAGARMEDQG